MPRKTPTGCRPSQLFGAMIIETRALTEMVSFVRSHPLPTTPAKVGEPDEEGEYVEGDGPDYQVDADGIARLFVNGPLTKYPTSYQEVFGGTAMVPLRRAVRHCTANPAVKGVFIDGSSPGGTVAGTNETAHDIRILAATKPTHLRVADAFCSGFLWIGSQVGFVSADPLTWVGSIGARSTLYDTSGAYEKDGIVVYVLTSDGADLKAVGVDGAPVSEAHRAEVIRELNLVTDKFVDAVAAGRGMSAADVRALATGRTWLGDEAMSLGLVDAVEPVDDAIARLREQISSGVDYRRPSPRTINPPAGDDRSAIMPFNVQQMQAVRGISGLEQVGEADAPDRVIAMAREASTVKGQLAAANETVTKVTGERDAALAKLPKAPNMELLGERAQRYVAQIDGLQQAGKANKEAATALKQLVGDEKTPNVVMLTKGEDGKCPMDAVLAYAGAQPPSVELGERDDARELPDGSKQVSAGDEGKKQGERAKKQRLERMGQK